MDMQITERMLPGIGMRYEIDTGAGGRLYVIAHRDGHREIGLAGDGDEPGLHVKLGQQASVTLAALLLGARFTVDTRSDDWVSSDEVVVDVVELGASSPAIGRTQAELDLDDPEAVVLAVMSDTTPELVEHDTVHRCVPGDRVVVAARGSRIEAVAAGLRGDDTAPS